MILISFDGTASRIPRVLTCPEKKAEETSKSELESDCQARLHRRHSGFICRCGRGGEPRPIRVLWAKLREGICAAVPGTVVAGAGGRGALSSRTVQASDTRPEDDGRLAARLLEKASHPGPLGGKDIALRASPGQPYLGNMAGEMVALAESNPVTALKAAFVSNTTKVSLTIGYQPDLTEVLALTSEPLISVDQ
jgi:hypothetical protein